MKNKFSDLNDHLFAQLERLSDEDMSEEKLKQEIGRAGAIVDVAQALVANAAIVLKAAQITAEHGGMIKVPFAQIEVKKL
jgi:hypothetical protein